MNINNINKTVAILLLMFCVNLHAQEDDMAKHKVVIQVSTSDPKTQQIALNNAVNLQRIYGLDDIRIEIVAYGPGLSLMTSKSHQAKRVKSLAQSNIIFSACGNTMKKVAKRLGHMPKLIKGVRVVKSGVNRIMILQEKGYSYIRP